jgi:ABC-2 type transport system ATP-binding protein
MKIEINQIVKSYSIKNVLDKISISINSNSNYCLLGKNGAGKTTLINILSDFIEADSGNIKFDNLDYKNNELEIKRNLGLLSEENFLIEELSGFEYLNFIGKLYKISKDDLHKRIESLTSYFFDNSDDIQRTISNYSTGMKKKLMFCATVIHKPNILILDEPFSGLDPIAANLFIEFLNRYRNNSRVIFLSSHNLNYIEKIATHIGVLENGKLLFNGPLNLFLENGTQNIDDSLLNKLGATPSKIKEVEWAF